MNDRASYHRLSFQVAAGGVSNILRQPATEAGQVWPTKGEVFHALDIRHRYRRNGCRCYARSRSGRTVQGCQGQALALDLANTMTRNIFSCHDKHGRPFRLRNSRIMACSSAEP